MKKSTHLKIIVPILLLLLATVPFSALAQDRMRTAIRDSQQSNTRERDWSERSKAIAGIHDNGEKMVRGAYVKLMRYQSAYSAEMAVANRTAHDPEDDLNFDIRAVASGAIEDIYERHFGEFVSKRDGDALKLERIVYKYTDGPEHLMYKAAVVYQDDPNSSEDWDSISVREMLSKTITDFESVRVYTSYDVLVRVGSGQRTYRALAVYKAGDLSGASSNVQVLDYIVGPEIMSDLLTETRPPVNAPWTKYVTSERYSTLSKAVAKASQEGRSLIPADGPAGSLVGDDFVSSTAGLPNVARTTQRMTPSASCSPVFVVTEVGFSGDLKLHHWTGDPTTAIAIDPNDTQPIWTSNGSVNYAAAYISAQTPVIFATLSITNPSPNQSATLRIKNGSTVIATVNNVSLSESPVHLTGINLTSLAVAVNTISLRDITLSWEASLDSGQTWSSIGQTGPHRLYMTYQQPSTNPFITGQSNQVVYPNTYDLALEKACGPANGVGLTMTLPEGILAITVGIDAAIKYNPALSLNNAHPLIAYATAAGIQCGDNANLLRGLLRTIGIAATTFYYWASPSNTATKMLRYRQPVLNADTFYLVSLMVTEQAHDCARTNPHFTFHALVSANGTLYDPSYGKSRTSLVFAETATGAVQQVNQALNVTMQDTIQACTHTTPVFSCP